MHTHFSIVTLRDNKAETGIHSSCSLLTEGCSWEHPLPTLAACTVHWAGRHTSTSVYGNSLAGFSRGGPRGSRQGPALWGLLHPRGHLLRVGCRGWTSLRPSSSDERLRGDTESKTLAQGSPSREPPEERERQLVGRRGQRAVSPQDTTLLCRSWARCLCLRTRGISGGKGAEGEAARASRSALKAPGPTRWTLAGPTLPRKRRAL